ncbi:MAG: hypothetical protein R2792_12115 [Saprospiraceae bacterium]
MIIKLNDFNLKESAEWLASQDKALNKVLRTYGPPPLWDRTPTYSTLVHIILEQQVSLSSANAAFARLSDALGTVTPTAFLELSDESLKRIGFSKQKTNYARGLAQAIVNDGFQLDALEHKSEEEVKAALMQFKGIGHWTADIYLSECLLRPDILPKGDIALFEAFKVLKGLAKRPDYEAFEKGTAHWRPWRSTGTRMLWHFYLCERERK